MYKKLSLSAFALSLCFAANTFAAEKPKIEQDQGKTVKQDIPKEKIPLKTSKNIQKGNFASSFGGDPYSTGTPFDTGIHGCTHTPIRCITRDSSGKCTEREGGERICG